MGALFSFFGCCDCTFFIRAAKEKQRNVVFCRKYCYNETGNYPKKDHTTENAVYVSGAVKHPGLYRYYGNKRVDDAITAVGGFCKNASTESINLAQFLQDGEQIVVLTKKQAKKQKSPKEDPAMVNDSKNRQDSQGASKVNINTASVEELMQLPGIGEAKAKMILDYRTQNGAFQKVEDIMKISGIKEGVYNKIKENITV